MSGNVDKPEEVKPNLIQYRHAIYRRVKITDQVSGHIEVNVDEALSAEREKTNEAWKQWRQASDCVASLDKLTDDLESRLKEAQTLLRSTNHDPAFWQDKIIALEKQVADFKDEVSARQFRAQELEAKVKERGEYISRMEDAIEELEKWKQGKKGIEDYYTVKEALATANAKIVELETKLEERSDCHNGLPAHAWYSKLSAANKRAEKLVEALEEICNARSAVQDNPNMLISSCHDAEATRDCVEMMKRYEASFELGEQAIKEFKP